MEGRDDGVGMELAVLVVALVLTLLRPSVDTERRDCGRRIPVGMTLCDNALGALLLLLPADGDSVELEDIERKAVGAELGGLDVRLRSLSLSLSFSLTASFDLLRIKPVASRAAVVAL